MYGIKWSTLKSPHVSNGPFHFDCQKKEWKEQAKCQKERKKQETEEEMMLYIRCLSTASSEKKERSNEKRKEEKI